MANNSMYIPNDNTQKYVDLNKWFKGMNTQFLSDFNIEYDF